MTWPVVVTGGAATGKSTVLSRFAHHGLRTASADAVVGEIWADPASASALCAILEVPYPLDRDSMRARLADPEFRAAVSQAVHPYVVDRLTAQQPTVVEIPLLLEACLQGTADIVVVADCRPATQLKRLTARLGDEKKATALLSTQLPNVVRTAFADWVIDTENDLADTFRQVDELVARLGFALAEPDR